MKAKYRKIVCYKSLQAMVITSQRRNLLQELFADLALEVDERAKGEF